MTPEMNRMTPEPTLPSLTAATKPLVLSRLGKKKRERDKEISYAPPVC